MLRTLHPGTQGYHTTKEGTWKKMTSPTELRVCQTCRYCTPKQAEGPIGLFCENPEVLQAGIFPQKSPTSIFWAVLKHCGEERQYWEKA